MPKRQGKNGRRQAPQPASYLDLRRAERLREVLYALGEVNKRIPVVVEGKKDALALRRLGLEGEIIILHRGKSFYEFAEDTVGTHRSVILLFDWDKTGETLLKRVGEGMRGHWEEFSAFREFLKALCQKDVKDIEGIPKLLMRLEGEGAPRDIEDVIDSLKAEREDLGGASG